MKDLLLTIISTSFNRKDLLKKTLDSVLAQAYPAVEQLVMDGGSEDGTADLLKSYEKKFAAKKYNFVWRSEKDSGQGEAMNKGLRLAKGEFIMILNSDDFLAENNLQLFMNRLITNPGIDLIYGNHDSLRDGQITTVTHHQYSLTDILRKGYQIPQSSAIFRRRLIERVGNFDEGLHYVAEHDLFLRMVKTGARVSYLPQVMQVTLEHSQRKATADAKTGWRETKKVNFRHGCGYFSRFYLLYLKNVYFGQFFDSLSNKLPNLYGVIKYTFNKLTG